MKVVDLEVGHVENAVAVEASESVASENPATIALRGHEAESSRPSDFLLWPDNVGRGVGWRRPSWLAALDPVGTKRAGSPSKRLRSPVSTQTTASRESAIDRLTKSSHFPSPSP